MIRRFACALRGLAFLLTRDASGRIHGVCAIAVVLSGLTLGTTPMEWAVLSLATGGVIAAEALNSAIEQLADRVTTRREESIRRLKDISAGGVLAAALGAAGTAAAVFVPRLLTLAGR